MTLVLLCFTIGLAIYLFADDVMTLRAPSGDASFNEASTPQEKVAKAPAPRDSFGSLPSDVPRPEAIERAPDARESMNEPVIAATPPASQEPAPEMQAPQVQQAPQAPQATPAPPRPQLAPEFVATLRRRAQEAMSRNDVTAARLFLERAAAGGDADALEELGRTYDPSVLERMGLRDIFPGDAQIAAKYYNEAQQARVSARASQP